MRAVLHKEISSREIGDVPDITALLDRVYGGRLSDRNRSMVVLASHRGLTTAQCATSLGSTSTPTASTSGHSPMADMLHCSRGRRSSNRKFDNEAIKQAVFGLLHEPPSNYGINRTTWIMPRSVAGPSGHGQPACPEVIRKITKSAGYRWRRARRY